MPRRSIPTPRPPRNLWPGRALPPWPWLSARRTASTRANPNWILRLSEIRKAVDIPLVLHGTSGVPEDAVRACVREGICKVNYATDLRIAYTHGVRALLAEKPDAYDPKAYGKAGRASVLKVVCERIRLVGSEGKA